jgi:Phage minor capsid protein 2
MNRERIDDLVDILGENFASAENTFVIRNSEELIKYIADPTAWKKKQVENGKRYKKELIGKARAKLSELNALTEKVYLLSYKEVNNEAIEVSKTELSAKIPQRVKDEIDGFKRKNALEIANLANIAYKTHLSNVRIISQLSTPDSLYDTIKAQMNKGIDNGLPVTYKNGANVSWKAYMEMNVRTTVHQEIGNEQIRTGADLGQIFYLCDSFGDCAPDHADYQGKMYYNEDADIPKEVQSFIDGSGIESMQSVRDSDPFLTTRPNCRHSFHAIPIDQAMGSSADEILKSEKLERGEYKDSNYEKVQEQRLNERTIRKYKMREENTRTLYDKTKDPEYLKQSLDAKEKVKEWQKTNREFIKSNPELLKRDYDRENIRVVTQDLGVRYDIRDLKAGRSE